MYFVASYVYKDKAMLVHKLLVHNKTDFHKEITASFRFLKIFKEQASFLRSAKNQQLKVGCLTDSLANSIVWII
jgi:hypothetical protein